MLLMHGLPGYAEDLRDLLPGPAVFSCVVYLERLELLQEPAQGGDGTVLGSELSAAAASAVAFSMLSIYVDRTGLSTLVDGQTAAVSITNP
jgi:hypothetical protein